MIKCDICGKQEVYPPSFIESWRLLNYTGLRRSDGSFICPKKDREGYGLFYEKELCSSCNDKISEAIREAIKTVKNDINRA